MSKGVKILISAVLVLIVFGVISFFCLDGVLAYFTSKDEAKDSLTAGNQESEIVEVWDAPEEIIAGQDYEKEVKVSNTGNVDCYVRVFAEFEDPTMAEAIDIDFNTSDWTAKQSDGYYYYKGILKPSEETKPLFTTLSADKDLSDMALIVYSETVQADGFGNAVDAFASYN